MPARLRPRTKTIDYRDARKYMAVSTAGDEMMHFGDCTGTVMRSPTPEQQGEYEVVPPQLPLSLTVDVIDRQLPPPSPLAADGQLSPIPRSAFSTPLQRSTPARPTNAANSDPTLVDTVRTLQTQMLQMNLDFQERIRQ